MSESKPMLPRNSEKERLDFVSRTYSNLTVVLLVPVSITIFLVVWGVQNLTPIYSGKDQSPLFLVADESGSSSSSEKLEDSVLNALVILAMIVVITVIMVILYKYRCMKVIMVWFIFSVAMIFFFLFWIWIDLVATKYQIPYDIISVSIVLWNFGVVGIVSLFYYAHEKMSQVYLVILSVILGWMLTRLPEWTTWAILIVVAIYDIVAVLCPKGPLQMLVREAQERNEPIPGFIYDSGSAQHDDRPARPPPRRDNPINEAGASPGQRPSSASPPVQREEQPASAQNTDRQDQPREEEEEEEEVDPFEAAEYARPFKLGLGDFIFYSLLVGRAAHYSYVSWMMCFICVAVGLIGTLCSLLFLRGKVAALPALPISIFLATAGYFLSRFVSAPFCYYMACSGLVV